MFEKGYLTLGLRIVLAYPLAFFLGGALLILITTVSFGILMGPCMLGFARMVRMAIRGEEVRLEHAFSGFEDGFVTALLAGIVYTALVAAGHGFFVVPGFVIGAVLIWMFPVLADNEGFNFGRALMGALDFVEDSAWRLLFGALLLVLGAVGLVVAGIGVFFTMPVALTILFVGYYRTVHPDEEVLLPEDDEEEPAEEKESAEEPKAEASKKSTTRKKTTTKKTTTRKTTTKKTTSGSD
jgi:hypothetical protein